MTKQRLELKLAEKSADTVHMLLGLALGALMLSWAVMWGWNEGLVPALPQQRLEDEAVRLRGEP